MLNQISKGNVVIAERPCLLSVETWDSGLYSRNIPGSIDEALNLVI